MDEKNTDHMAGAEDPSVYGRGTDPRLSDDLERLTDGEKLGASIDDLDGLAEKLSKLEAADGPFDTSEGAFLADEGDMPADGATDTTSDEENRADHGTTDAAGEGAPQTGSDDAIPAHTDPDEDVAAADDLDTPEPAAEESGTSLDDLIDTVAEDARSDGTGNVAPGDAAEESSVETGTGTADEEAPDGDDAGADAGGGSPFTDVLSRPAPADDTEDAEEISDPGVPERPPEDTDGYDDFYDPLDHLPGDDKDDAKEPLPAEEMGHEEMSDTDIPTVDTEGGAPMDAADLTDTEEAEDSSGMGALPEPSPFGGDDGTGAFDGTPGEDRVETARDDEPPAEIADDGGDETEVPGEDPDMTKNTSDKDLPDVDEALPADEPERENATASSERQPDDDAALSSIIGAGEDSADEETWSDAPDTGAGDDADTTPDLATVPAGDGDGGDHGDGSGEHDDTGGAKKRPPKRLMGAAAAAIVIAAGLGGWVYTGGMAPESTPDVVAVTDDAEQPMRGTPDPAPGPDGLAGGSTDEVLPGEGEPDSGEDVDLALTSEDPEGEDTVVVTEVDVPDAEADVPEVPQMPAVPQMPEMPDIDEQSAGYPVMEVTLADEDPDIVVVEETGSDPETGVAESSGDRDGGIDDLAALADEIDDFESEGDVDGASEYAGVGRVTALEQSMSRLAEGLSGISEELTGMSERITDLEEADVEAEERISRVERLARGQNAILSDFAKMEESLEQTQVVLLDLSSRIGELEATNPADRDAVNAALSEMESRIDRITANLSIMARMTVQGVDTLQADGASAGSVGVQTSNTPAPRQGNDTNYQGDDSFTISSDPGEQVPGDVENGDFIEGYGYVLDILPAADGQKLVVMENGSVLIPD